MFSDLIEKNKPLISKILLVLAYGVLLFLALNRHSKHDLYDYRNEIFSDKAGYYVYLPATLKYNFNAENFPKNVDIKTAGFKFNGTKIETKYTYGVSFFQMPFYCIADILASPLGFEKDGFSMIYNRIVSISAVSYFFIASLLLRSFLRSFVKNRIVIDIGFTLVLFGTNLIYYVIAETGMSHVYSFSLFCFLLWYLNRIEFFKSNVEKLTLINSINIGLISGFIILIRPTNIIFCLSLLFFSLNSIHDIKHRMFLILNFKTLLILFLFLFIVFLPQFLYWKTTFGEFLYYSYSKEGFNWLRPELINSWFSANSGLFTYGILYLLIVMSIIFGLKDRSDRKNAIYFFSVFAIISYVNSSWWDWSFGCSFGGRSYTEYLAIFCIPFISLINKLFEKQNRLSLSIFFMISIFFIIVNLKMIYNYDGCFYGKGNWDWNEYFRLITN